MMKKPWVLAIMLALGSGAHAGIDARKAAYVPGPLYFETLTTEISRAKSSITAYIYVFPLRERSEAMTYRLAESLAAARKRGVQVTVVLDEFGGFEGTFAPGRGNNEAAYRFLEARGVDVFYDAVGDIVHAKAVVIDGETVIIGSNNWSETAFTKNVEACLLVRDKKVAQDALKDLSRAGKKKRVAEEVAGAYVPVSFLSDPRGLGALVGVGAERPLDVYLWLWKLRAEQLDNADKREDSDGWVRVAYGPLAGALGITGVGEKGYRREITMILRKKLLKRYGLIEEARFEYGKDALVRLKLPSDDDSVVIPAGYWAWGWDKRLPLSGKAMYLLNLHYANAFATRPRWSLSGETLSQRHHVSDHVLSGGTTELRRANLVDVEYGELTRDGAGARRPNIYSPQPLYDPAVLEGRWAALEKTYGREALVRGRECAAMVYEDSDGELVERLILLERQVGRGRMDAALKTIGEKHPSNPRRSAGYLVGILTSPER